MSKKNKGIVKKSNSELKPLKKRTAARKRLNIDMTHRSAPEEENDNDLKVPSSPEKVLPTFAEESEPLPEEGCKGLKGKINRIIKQIMN